MYKFRPFKNLFAINNGFLKNKRKKFGTKIIKLYVIQCPELDKNRKSVIKYEKRVGEIVKKNDVVAEISSPSWNSTPIRATVAGVIDRVYATDGTEIAHNQDLFGIRPLNTEDEVENDKVVNSETSDKGENKHNIKKATGTVTALTVMTDAASKTIENKIVKKPRIDMSANTITVDAKHIIESKNKTLRSRSNPKTSPKDSMKPAAKTPSNEKVKDYARGNTMKFITELLCEEPKPMTKFQQRPKNNVQYPQKLHEGDNKYEGINESLLDYYPEMELKEIPVSYDQIHSSKPNDKPVVSNPRCGSVSTNHEKSKKMENKYESTHKDHRRNQPQSNFGNAPAAQTISLEKPGIKREEKNFAERNRLQMRKRKRNESPKSIPNKRWREDHFYLAKEIKAPFTKTRKRLHCCDIPTYLDEIEEKEEKPKKVLEVYPNQNKKRMLSEDYETMRENDQTDIQKYPELSLPKLPKCESVIKTAEKIKAAKPVAQKPVKPAAVEPLHDINFFEEKNPFNILSKVSGSQAARSTISKLEEKETEKLISSRSPHFVKTPKVKVSTAPKNILAVSYTPLEVKTHINKTNLGSSDDDNMSVQSETIPSLPPKPKIVPVPKQPNKIQNEQPTVINVAKTGQIKPDSQNGKKQRLSANMHAIKRIPKRTNSRYELEASENIVRKNRLKLQKKIEQETSPKKIDTKLVIESGNSIASTSNQKSTLKDRPAKTKVIVKKKKLEDNFVTKNNSKDIWNFEANKISIQNTKPTKPTTKSRSTTSGIVRIGEQKKSDFKAKTHPICTSPPQVGNTVSGVRIIDRFSELSPTIDSRSEFEYSNYSSNAFNNPTDGSQYVSLTRIESINAQNKMKAENAALKNEGYKNNHLQTKQEQKPKIEDSEVAKMKIREKNQKIKKIPEF